MADVRTTQISRTLLQAALVFSLISLACCGPEEEDPAGRADAAKTSSPGITKPRSSEAKHGDEWEVRVSVKNAETGHPVPAAKVFLMVQGSDNPRDLSMQEAWSDRDGVAGFAFGKASRAIVWTGHSPERKEIELSGRSVDVELPVRVEFPVKGKVVDTAGRPLSGADVMLYGMRWGKGTDGASAPPLPDEAGGYEEFRRKFHYNLAALCSTGEDGTFRGVVDSMKPLEAAVRIDGYMTADWRRVPFSPDGVGHGPVDIVVHSAAPLEVRFRGPGGLPVGRRKITIRESLRSERKRRYFEGITVPFSSTKETDDTGTARFDVPVGMEIIAGTNPGKRSERREGMILLFPEGEEEKGGRESLTVEGPLTVIAKPMSSVRIECTVLDKGGRPLPDADLLFSGKKVRTEQDGKVTLMMPPESLDGICYRVEKEGFISREGTIPLPDIKGPQTTRLDIELEKAPTAELGSGLEGKRVWLVARGKSAQSGRVEGGEFVVPEGALSFCPVRRERLFLTAGPDDGPVDLLVERGTYSFHLKKGLTFGAGLEAEVRELMGQEIARTGPGVVLEGRVSLPAGSNPQWIDIVIMRNDLPEVRRFDPFGIRRGGMGWVCIQADSDGSFTIGGLVPGRYAVAAALWEWGMRTDLYEEVVVPPGEETVFMELSSRPEKGALEVLVTDSHGKAKPGTAMILLDPVDSPLGPPYGTSTRFITDEEGRIEIPDLVPGRYGVIAWVEDPAADTVAARVLVETHSVLKIEWGHNTH